MFKRILIICGSIILLLGVSLLGYKIYINYSSRYINICVASHQISQRTMIKDEDILQIKVPKENVNDDVYVSKDEVLNKYVKLSYSIPKGSLFYKTALEDNIKDLANTLLKDNEVNYDIYVSDVRINTANLVKNMYVDLYLTIESKEKPISDLLLSNARITGLYDDNNKLILDYDNDSRVAIITLAINKQDVNVINKAFVLGKINFVINTNAYDTNLIPTLNSESILFDYFD